MDTKIIADGEPPCGQNRAPGLYDEQLQRQQQEKFLFCAEKTSEIEERLLTPIAPPPRSAFARLRRRLHLYRKDVK